MYKISAIVVIYNSRKFIEPVFSALTAQTYPDLDLIAVINRSDDGSEELIRTKFPQVRLIRPGRNLGFAGGNNFAIAHSTAELVQLVNPDLILDPDYIATLAGAFADPRVGAATGKLLRYDFEANKKSDVIDSVGLTMSDSGRGRDRGQLELDHGQYNQPGPVFGVSGAGPMYRRSALEQTKYCEAGHCEYFDEDFLAYWEDADLSWRLNNAGFINYYLPQAVAYHGRAAGQSEGGYLHLWNFVKHHRRIPRHIRRLNYKNHILMYLKNTRRIHPAFVLRELAMFAYVLIFEPSTLGVLPELFRQLPKNRRKRRAQTKKDTAMVSY